MTPAALSKRLRRLDLVGGIDAQALAEFNLASMARGTLAFIALAGIGWAVLGWPGWVQHMVELWVAYALAFALMTWLRVRSPRQIATVPLLLVLLAGPLFGAALAAPIAFLPSLPEERTQAAVAGHMAVSFIFALALAATQVSVGLVLQRQRRQAETRERALQLERELLASRLAVLQAQIEPHFLFNTLANVTSLIHTRPDDAKHMLEEFIGYLRASLATTRENETTLAKEFVLMQSFLSVLKVRMGNRLAVRVELPDDLQQFVLPPMLIQPLVENAIKHGVEPKIEGGEILLKAAKVGDAVAIEVTDTGLGFQNSTSNGIGLKNVRERLDKLYEGRATLTIEDNTPSGTKITIRIPA